MRNMFVGNLSYETTDADLEAAFRSFGAVDRASIVRERDTGQSRGFGFVEMSNDSDADRAMTALNGHDLNGRTLNVNEARVRAPRGGKQPGSRIDRHGRGW
jgi:cold-inducible RNA-binding protein